MAAHCFLVVTAPVTAQVTITLSPRAICVLLGASRFDGALYVQGDLAEQRRELFLIGRRQFVERVAQEVPGRDARAVGHLLAGGGQADDPAAAVPLLCAAS